VCCSYCSRSGKIGGVTITDANRDERIQALPSPCCNDTTHTSWNIKDVLIPPRQMWTVAFPNMSTINAGSVSNFVKALYNWRAAGASIHYNVTAETTALQQSGDPKIQVSRPKIPQKSKEKATHPESAIHEIRAIARSRKAATHHPLFEPSKGAHKRFRVWGLGINAF
jgi:hypothetical protein